MKTLNIDTLVCEGNFPFTCDEDLKVLFNDSGPIDTVKDPYVLGRGAHFLGECAVKGKPITPFARTTGNKKGDTIVTLQSPVEGWQVGDRVFMPGVSADGVKQFGVETPTPVVDDDKTTIAAISDDKLTITLTDALKFDHAAVNRFGGVRKMVLANLSRSLTFESENPAPDRAGHVMCMVDDPAAMQIFDSVAIRNCGRTNKKKNVTDPDGLGGGTANPRARYSLHFHLQGPGSKEKEVKHCVIEGNPGWGLVNHGSNCCFDSNFVTDFVGAGIVGENGNETGCICNNLVSRARNVGGLNPPEFDPAGLADWAKNGTGIWTQGGGIQITGENIITGTSADALAIMGIPFQLPGKSAVGFETANLPEGTTYDKSTVPVYFVPQKHDGLHCYGIFGNALKMWNINDNGAQKPLLAQAEFTNFTGEAVNGVFRGYSSCITFKDFDIVQPRIVYQGWGSGHSGVASEQYYINCKFRAFGVGIHVGTNYLNSFKDCETEALLHFFTYSPRPGGVRTIRIDGHKFTPVPDADIQAAIKAFNSFSLRMFDKYQGQKEVRIFAAHGEAVGLYRETGFNWTEAIKRRDPSLDAMYLDNKRFYYSEDGPGFVLGTISNCPDELKPLTNAQALAQFSKCVGDVIPPDGTRTLDEGGEKWCWIDP